MAKLKSSLAEKLRQTVGELIDGGKLSSLSALARKAEVDPGQLSRFMRGERDLTQASFASICGVVGLRLVPDPETKLDAQAGTGFATTGTNTGKQAGDRATGHPLSQNQPSQAEFSMEGGLAADQREQSRLHRFEASLKPDERIVWRGKHLGLSHAEIARQLNSTGEHYTEAEVDLMVRWLRKRWANQPEEE